MSDSLRSSAMSADDQLMYTSKVFIRFTNGSTQWVNIKLFELPGTVLDDQETLSLLLHHVRYRDSYAGTDDKDMMTLHGPYRLEAIGPESFTNVTPEDAEATLLTWAVQDAPLDDVTSERLEQELYPRIRTATSLYQLVGLGEESHHDWGWVVGQTGFLEFVLIDRGAKSLALVVASDD